jgi:hypothetical protein
MHIGDPLLVFFPDLYHGSSRFLALVVYADSPVSETGDKNITFDLVRSKRSNARSRSSRNVL